MKRREPELRNTTQARSMSKLRVNLEKIQRGEAPSTRSEGLPCCDEDVLAVLKDKDQVIDTPSSIQAHALAKKVGQQVYGFESAVGEWTFWEYCGALSRDELRVAHQRQERKKDELAAYWYSFYSTRGEKYGICWLSDLTKAVAKKSPSMYFLKGKVYFDPAPELDTNVAMSMLQCNGCKKWKCVDKRALALFFRAPFTCHDLGVEHGEEDTKNTPPRSLHVAD